MVLFLINIIMMIFRCEHVEPISAVHHSNISFSSFVFILLQTLKYLRSFCCYLNSEVKHMSFLTIISFYPPNTLSVVAGYGSCKFAGR